MAELKPIEVVMRIDFASSNGVEVVAHAERVSELVRCKDCKYFDMSDVGGTIPPIVYRCKRFARTYREADDYC